ncbi:RNA polymerase sigma factor [Candidatus Woesebacteria bacterium]|nr:RNA polymerase sigma factor [Candidatus Woesebacteria bacterium]
MEEKTLISKLKKGNPKAVNYWFNTYNGRLLTVVLSKVSDKQDAEEIVQQTFLNCLKHLPLFMARSSIWTWMNSIAHHEIADYFRKKYAKKALKTTHLSELLMIENISDSAEISQKVSAVINKMKNYYGELLMLKYVDGKKVSAIAKELGRSIKSVESDLFRARNEFRTIWQE